MRNLLSWLLVAAGCGCAGSSALPPPAAGDSASGAHVSARVAPRRVGSPYAYEWFMRAELQRARGDLARAIEAYRSALSSSDEDPYVLARLATALDEAGAREQAEDALEAAFRQSPHSEAAWLARAEIAARHGERERAFEAYERAEAAAPRSPRAPLSLSRLLLEAGQPERARAVLLRYEARVLPGLEGASRARLTRALIGDDAESAYALARAQLAAQTPDVEAVLGAATLALERDHCGLALDLLGAVPARPDHAALRMRALLACAEIAAAEQLLSTSDPELFGGMLEVARIYLRLGHAEAAVALAETYRALHPSELAATLVLAQAKLGSGAYAEAAELFAQLPASARDHAVALSGLAQALEAQGLAELAARIRR